MLTFSPLGAEPVWYQQEGEQGVRYGYSDGKIVVSEESVPKTWYVTAENLFLVVPAAKAFLEKQKPRRAAQVLISAQQYPCYNASLYSLNHKVSRQKCERYKSKAVQYRERQRREKHLKQEPYYASFKVGDLFYVRDLRAPMLWRTKKAATLSYENRSSTRRELSYTAELEWSNGKARFFIEKSNAILRQNLNSYASHWLRRADTKIDTEWQETRVQVWPGDTSRVALIAKVKENLHWTVSQKQRLGFFAVTQGEITIFFISSS